MPVETRAEAGQATTERLRDEVEQAAPSPAPNSPSYAAAERAELRAEAGEQLRAVLASGRERARGRALSGARPQRQTVRDGGAA